MSLRVYDPAECDEQGPLDWERCRTCGGSGRKPAAVSGQVPSFCAPCDGHGSLKAAALATRALEVVRAREGHWERYTDEAVAERLRTIRCEGCGHPMSDGTWEARSLSRAEPFLPTVLEFALGALRDGLDPSFNGWWNATHWSPCDEGCRHHPLTDCRAVRDDETHPYAEWSWDNGYSTWPREASWRAVDVRTLGWPHDLRPEKLAVLCLRCWSGGKLDR